MGKDKLYESRVALSELDRQGKNSIGCTAAVKLNLYIFMY